MLKERGAILLMLNMTAGGYEHFDSFPYQEVTGITEKPFCLPIDELYEAVRIHNK